MSKTYIDEEIERLEERLSIKVNTKDETGIWKDTIQKLRDELKPLYIARGLGHMIIDGLKEELCEHNFSGKVCGADGCKETCLKCGKVIYSDDDTMNSCE